MSRFVGLVPLPLAISVTSSTRKNASIVRLVSVSYTHLELGEEEKAVLDRKQHYLCDMISIQPEITVTYFKPDVRKSGGTYVTAIGNLKRIDEIERVLILTDGCKIPLDDVVDIESNLLRDMF